MFDAEHFFDGYKNNKDMHFHVLSQHMIMVLDGLFYVIQMAEHYLTKFQK